MELLEQDRKVRRLNEIIPQTLSGRELFIIINRYGLYGEKDNDTEGDRKKTWDFQILCFEDRKEGDRKTQAGILGVL